jgi:hypothetical protein
MESNIFDINRLGLLLKKMMLENRSSALYFALGILAIFVAAFGLLAWGNHINASSQQNLFTFCFVVFGLIAADRSFASTKSRIKGMFYLLTPASKFEKVVASILTTSLLFPILYTALFFVVKLIFTVISLSGLFEIESISASFFFNLEAIRTILIFQAIFMLGSIWFRKHSIFKTTAVIIFFFFAIAIFLGIVVRMGIGDFHSTGTNLNLNLGTPSSIFTHPYVDIVLWLLVPFFWVVTYFRLSEKQL